MIRTRMTDADRERADREYDALPGTPPNGYSFRSNAEIVGREYKDVVHEMQAAHPEATFWRLTRTDDGVWLEAWDAQPYKQATFNPPYTAGVPRP